MFVEKEIFVPQETVSGADSGSDFISSLIY